MKFYNKLYLKTQISKSQKEELPGNQIQSIKIGS